MEILFGIAGLVLVSIAIWLRKEKQQDILFIIGGVLLLVHSVYIEDVVFIVLQVIFILSATIELIRLRKKNHEAS